MSPLRTPCRTLVLLAALPLLGGCLSSVLPEPEASRLYHLPASQLQPRGNPLALGLVIDEFSVAPALEGDRLIATAADGEVQRIAGARWVGQPARLVQDALVQRLRQLNVVDSVDARSLRFAAALRITGELQALQYQSGSDRSRVALTLHLVCTAQARSLGQRSFVTDVAPASREAAAVVAALAEGLDQVAVGIADWIAAEASRCGTAGLPNHDGFESD